MSEGKHCVIVHVYDLSNGLARQLSQSFFGKSFDAVYHTGVVVYGREYSFGVGIESEVVGHSRYGTPIEKLDFGYTEVPKELFDQFLEDISSRFTPQTYNLLRNNCNNFSDEVVEFLVGDRIPDKILNLPKDIMATPFGAALVPFLEQMNPASRPQDELRVRQFPLENSSSSEKSATANSSKAALPSLSGMASAAQSIPRERQKQKDPREVLQDEIKKEFSLIMSSGAVKANDAAIQAVKNVTERHGTRLVNT